MLNRKLVQKLNVNCFCPNPDPTDHMADGHLGACLSDLDVKVVHSDGFHQVRRLMSIQRFEVRRLMTI